MYHNFDVTGRERAWRCLQNFMGAAVVLFVVFASLVFLEKSRQRPEEDDSTTETTVITISGFGLSLFSFVMKTILTLLMTSLTDSEHHKVPS